MKRVIYVDSGKARTETVLYVGIKHKFYFNQKEFTICMEIYVLERFGSKP